jgi:hypothetical protein
MLPLWRIATEALRFRWGGLFCLGGVRGQLKGVCFWILAAYALWVGHGRVLCGMAFLQHILQHIVTAN